MLIEVGDRSVNNDRVFPSWFMCKRRAPQIVKKKKIWRSAQKYIVCADQEMRWRGLNYQNRVNLFKTDQYICCENPWQGNTLEIFILTVNYNFDTSYNSCSAVA